MLEEYTTEQQRSVVRFLWAKGLNVKDIHKEMSPFYDGKCSSHKAVHNWVANASPMTKTLKRRCGSGWDNSQKLLCCWFRRTGKAMGQVYQYWRRMCREMTVFSPCSNIILCNVGGHVTTSDHQLYRVQVLETLFRLVLRLVQSQPHVTTITYSTLTRLHSLQELHSNRFALSAAVLTYFSQVSLNYALQTLAAL
jgi:hypothetical protein